MRRMLLVAVVMVLVLTGLPLLMGMGAATCPSCPPAMTANGQCLGVLAGAAAMLALLLGGRLRSRSYRLPPLVYARLFERPPQLV